MRACSILIVCWLVAGRASAADTVPVTFESTSKKLQVEVRTVEAGDPHWQCPELLCRTPCTLELPPRAFEFCVGGEHVSRHVGTVAVSPAGSDVRLGAPTKGARAVALLLAGAGLGATVAGAIGLDLWRTSYRDDRGLLVGGAVTLGLGAAMSLSGVALFVLNRHTVSAHPRAALGIGAAGVRGTF